MTFKKLELSDFLRAAPPLEVKLASTAGAFEGYASLFDTEPDRVGDIIAAGAFKASLAQHKRDRTDVAMLWAHDPAEPIGRWLDISEDRKGLVVVGQLNLATDRGKQAHEHMKAGDATGLSIGYRITPKGVTYNADGTATLTAIDLLEISVVTVPAKARARITAVKGLQSIADVKRILKEGGLSNAAAEKIAAGGWPALVGGSDEPSEDNQVQKALGSLAATLKRSIETYRKENSK